jgi:hypothetical protein
VSSMEEEASSKLMCGFVLPWLMVPLGSSHTWRP